MTGQPLSLRLALVLSGVVIAVLLITGFAVNRLVSRGLEQQLTDVQRDRLGFFAQQLEGLDLGQPRVAAAVERAMQRVTRGSGGRIAIVDSSGTELVAAGQLPPGVDGERVEEPIPGEAGLTLAYELPAGRPAFLGIFNATLLIAGVLAVAALVLASALLSDR